MTPLDIARVRRAFPGRRIDYYSTIDSTMRAAVDLETGAAVVAEEQTAGQGRHGHSWHSAARAGIYCSVSLDSAPVLTLALGLAAQHAIFEAAGIRCDLRWPNDLMLGGAKVAGILAQAAGARAVAGIGINVGQSEFPAELAGEATSLLLASGRRIGREQILISLLAAVDEFTKLDKDSVLRLFEASSTYARGRRVTVRQPEGTIEGVTAGLDPSGFLVLRRDDGTDTLILAGGVRATGS